MLTYGSLFSGIGGLDLGLDRAGMTCKWQVEIDDYATKVLERHWPNVRRWRDVRTWPQSDTTPVDLICGGDPCQANSRANAPHGSKAESLGGEFIRIVDVLRPRIVLRENPPSRKDAPWTWQRFRTDLESLGYAVFPFRFRSCCVGAECRRERVFLLAELGKSAGDRLEGGSENGADGRGNQDVGVPPPVHTPDRVQLPRPCGYGSSADVPGGMDRLRCLGNAVVPQVSQWLGERIIEYEAGE